MSASPPAAVYILNWNGRPYLAECLSALVAQTYRPFTVTLIDNGSTDGSLDFVRAHFPDVGILDNGRNLGFADGNNAALRKATAEVVALLNPDVVASPDWLARLVEALAEERVGIAGSKLWYPGGQTLQHAGGIIRRPQAMPDHYGVRERDEGQHDARRDVDYVIGGAVAIRREVIERIGLLDEGFFLYFEDADYCFRAREAGYRVVYAPAATAIHVESAVAVKGSFSYLVRFHAGRWRFLLKHFGAAELLTDTFPAETDWLERVDLAERRAAALAYEQTVNGLAEVFVTRERDGRAGLSAEQRDAIRVGLLALRERAWALPGQITLSDLESKVEVREQPFHSDAPVVGPLVASFRTAWNNVAGRWHVLRLAAQQNDYNRELLTQVAAYEALLREQTDVVREQAARHLAMQEEARGLAERVAEAQTKLAELERRAGELPHSDQG